MPGAWELESVLADARRKEGLDDVGPGPFEEPLGVLLEAYAGAGLNETGAHLLRGGIVHSLRVRLRAQEWFRRRPEIADEQVADPVVVVGMMRSGTTLLQRLLAADERFRCARGWEVVEAAPPLDLDWGAEDPRIAKALAREEQSRQWVPELYAIHPMYALEAEEEIVFLADAFLSHVPESGAHVPAYRSWIDTQDFAPAYDHLHRMLQLLQWQQRQRGVEAERWVLKTPAHLGYLDDLRTRFPGLHVVHLHRDPVETIASGASLNATLHAMHADTVDLHRVGAEWIERMGWTNDRALASRAAWGDDPGLVTDLGFADAVADPIGQVARVYDAIGLELTAHAELAMRDWLQRRPRETGRPDYTPETYGLTADRIRDRFA
ncbi:sulfotransferase [Nocardioides sp. Root1257]|uniref:sulfotransferase family protein n=1 Tax=unclassified Nocardioides TaxID=2615069 RepID=UPI0006FD468F|nr:MULTISPECIES: sulfotransferase [unclassified Nocardioides]KQW48630.1 sulfotransferase [Nocardioides sp. Root1257]KRC47806.1 sulfotransferase [Nocardioides sp. Root224]